MKKILLCLLLAGCSSPSEYTLEPNKKFIDGNTTILGRLKIDTKDFSSDDYPETILFNDGQGGEYTIYETSSKDKK
jgi:hypothetical protein